jgi:hypothetical protein
VNPGRDCQRVSLTTDTKRRLWSESGGYCQNPSCAKPLFVDDSDTDFAEMAHIIPASAGGPRDVPMSNISPLERAHHRNIVVLCANCHTIVDKDPQRHPADLMTQWKERHQHLLEQAIGTPAYSSRRDTRASIAPLLAANKLIHQRYGPQAGEFSDSTAQQWTRHVRTTILPNSRAILRTLEKNRHLLSADEINTLDKFALHLLELEHRHLLGDWTAGSIRFPSAIECILEDD